MVKRERAKDHKVVFSFVPAEPVPLLAPPFTMKIQTVYDVLHQEKISAVQLMQAIARATQLFEDGGLLVCQIAQYDKKPEPKKKKKKKK